MARCKAEGNRMDTQVFSLTNQPPATSVFNSSRPINGFAGLKGVAIGLWQTHRMGLRIKGLVTFGLFYSLLFALLLLLFSSPLALLLSASGNGNGNQNVFFCE